MKVVKTWKENTNNDWGFGGYIAKFTQYDNGIIVRKGRNYHRHTGTSSANCVFVIIEPGFIIPVDKYINCSGCLDTLNNISCIYIYQHDDHYYAVSENGGEKIEKYGDWIYKKIRTIEVSV